MTERVKFETKSGTAEGELALPAGDAKAPAVVVIQEYWGVNDHVRALVTRLAEAGFVALAPDLYDGVVTTNADEATAKMKALDWAVAIGKIDGAVAFTGSHARSNGHVGVMGFCMGGALALAAATHVPGLHAVVSFYGQPPLDQADWNKVRAPVQTHVGRTDDWVTPELAKKLETTLQACGKSIEVNLYDAGHAFVNDSRPQVYNPTEAPVAWGRAVAFLRTNLA